ncbi:MAG TPA: L,D-transpeptidase family protein [Rhizomicrobium sp.]|nr:L,D-transpeptidase family protein [Rhizomicrobium sp.]
MTCSIREWRCYLLAAIIALLPASSWAQDRQSQASIAEALRTALTERHASAFADGAPDPLFDFYASRNFAPAWTGPDSDGNAVAAVVSTLGHADAQGLQARDYSATARRWNALPEEGSEVAAFELSLTSDLMRYAADVRLGRVNPAQVYKDVELPAATFEFVSVLNTALKRRRIEHFLADLPPSQPEYRGLAQGLATYRLRQSEGGWTKVPGGGEIPADPNNPRFRALISRLSQEDPVLAANPTPPAEEVRDSVMRFQARNGLNVDGRIGGATLAALNVSIGVRITQIITNMERWRWLPRRFENNYVLVNVPDQSAKFIANGEVALESRAIVGRLGSRTPIVRMLANSLVINPPWHVPEDIADASILPKLRQDPNYLANKNMVLANGPPDDPQGRTIAWRNMKTMPYLVDQNPGPDSAMGTMMADAPNSFGVYLHDTPGKALFKANTRLASNGCIRVENMLELSALMLGGEQENAMEQLRATIATGQTQRLPLEREVPIYLIYQTAIAYPDGTIGFRGDPYGRDKSLAVALMAARD